MLAGLKTQRLTSAQNMSVGFTELAIFSVCASVNLM
jgi:hypothetical protein